MIKQAVPVQLKQYGIENDDDVSDLTEEFASISIDALDEALGGGVDLVAQDSDALDKITDWAKKAVSLASKIKNPTARTAVCDVVASNLTAFYSALAL